MSSVIKKINKFNLEIFILNTSYITVLDEAGNFKEFDNYKEDEIKKIDSWENTLKDLERKYKKEVKSKVEYSPDLKLEIYIDDCPLKIPKLGDEYAKDLLGLEKSLDVKDDEILIFNCSCGFPGDAGISNGVNIKLIDEVITWEFEYPLSLKSYDNKDGLNFTYWEYTYNSLLGNEQKELHFDFNEYRLAIVNTVKEYKMVMELLQNFDTFKITTEVSDHANSDIKYFYSPLNDVTTKEFLKKHR